jgi:CheY-like chemotaxis protein
MDISGYRRHLLIVENHLDAAESLRMLTNLWGFHPKVARHGEEALSLAINWRPDVVLLDLRLPGQDGFEVTRRLRQVVRPEPAFIAWTSYFSPALLDRTAQEGFVAHLLKAADPEELKQLLDRLTAAPT